MLIADVRCPGYPGEHLVPLIESLAIAKRAVSSKCLASTLQSAFNVAFQWRLFRCRSESCLCIESSTEGIIEVQTAMTSLLSARRYSAAWRASSLVGRLNVREPI